MPLKLHKVESALKHLAPLELAEDWDNVGMLIRPTRRNTVSKILLAIDLTRDVLAEAVHKKVHMVVAYHPPIFSGFKKLVTDRTGRIKERIAVEAIENNIAVYSPHTSLDAVEGGLTDWLCSGLGDGVNSAWKESRLQPPREQYKLVVFVPGDHVDRVREELAGYGAGVIGDYKLCSFNAEGIGTFWGGAGTDPAVGRSGRLEKVPEIRLEMSCRGNSLPDLIEELYRVHPYEEPAFDIYKLEPRPQKYTGQGRLHQLNKEVTLATLVRRIKKHLGLAKLRVAAPAEVRSGKSKIEEIGVCPGAGASVFEGTYFQAYLTGEMRHHDILQKLEQGSAVILTEHSNCERPYLPTFRKDLQALLGRSVKVEISKKDAEPIQLS